MFDIPIYHKSNIAMDLIPDLQSEVFAEYDRRKFYLDANPEMGKHYRKLSVYNEHGQHSIVKGNDPMINISSFPKLQKIIHEHTITFPIIF